MQITQHIQVKFTHVLEFNRLEERALYGIFKNSPYTDEELPPGIKKFIAALEASMTFPRDEEASV